ncbi:hypothetical protein CVULP_0825 [Campylobacter vulpis]|nr:hypothetical protein [Campylobacter vulpis]MBS4276038.1 hypothetical protein [Campylobacter vulpis]MBS4307433.1 hypothetical protein [Campylobacter vulpis]MBS4330374.1 hypothetical protein [Campylobacter vulpis]MBS4407347.1 hypothetical protein [Campylobacter vulpis]MBS4423944.1 hypothetical protein [Campylobacter vulpis]
MPILDIRAGQGALRSVNHAIANLQNARALRSKNIENAFHTFGNALHKHKSLEEQIKTNELMQKEREQNIESGAEDLKEKRRFNAWLEANFEPQSKGEKVNFKALVKTQEPLSNEVKKPSTMLEFANLLKR